MAPIDDDDFVTTIFDDDETIPNEEEISWSLSARSSKKRPRETSTHPPSKRSKPSTNPANDDDDSFASDFEFAPGDTELGALEDFDGWGINEDENDASKGGDKKGVDVNDIVERRRKKIEIEEEAGNDDDDKASEDEKDDEFEGFGDDDELMGDDVFGMRSAKDEGTSEDDEGLDPDDEDDNGSVAEPVAHPMDMDDGSEEENTDEDPEEEAKKAAFFAPAENGAKHSDSAITSFLDLQLSRPILKGLAAVGFAEPTPIQAKAIPVALMGKDVVGGAVTGSGKTAAFLIPILERLVYRPTKSSVTRVAILMPTRELAVQCFNVAKKIAGYTDITFAQLVGGFSVREQEQVLKTRPDVIIATPGRFIDHMRNSASFALDTLEILVLDEADRMLEDGFADELNEIIKTIPKSRQTMLFSATMTDSVDNLIRVGLNRPVRLMVDAKKQTVSGLVQEFVRLRPGRENRRLATLMWLCKNVYHKRTIIFFRQKKEAHRVRVIFLLVGLKAAELHGSMSQEQRIHAVESFRSGEVSFLLATDLASRGLDIKNVDTVVNYETPQTHEIYLHRVGRTARAGRSGRACTIAAEPDRKIVRAAVKTATRQGAEIASRTVPPAEIDEWYKKLEGFESEIEGILEEEKEERAMNNADRDIKKGENLVLHEAEIKSRPKRTWFENEKEKKAAKDRDLAQLNGAAAPTKKKGKLSNKQKKKLDLKDERKAAPMFKRSKTDRASASQTKKGKSAGKKTKARK